VTIIGIDPGVTGGICFLEPEGTQFACPLPVDGSDIDVTKLAQLLEGYRGCGVKAFVELPSLRGTSRGNLTTGANYGRILATLKLAGISARVITPSKWIDAFFPKPKAPRRAKGEPKPESKPRDKKPGIALVKQLYPNLELVMPGARVPHMGVVESALIAEWGRRHG